MEKQEWLHGLRVALVNSNRYGWASEKNDTAPIFPDWKRHTFHSADGLWVSDDNYSGYFRAPGFTLVSYKKRSAYMLQYGGTGMHAGLEIQAKSAFSFLKEALNEASASLSFPPRGPPNYRNGLFFYEFEVVRGEDLTDFSARERISHAGIPFFLQTIEGSIIRHKGSDGKVIEPWDF